MLRNPAITRNVHSRLVQPRRRLEAENLFLRHQLSIALRRAPPRLRLRGSDRALLVWMTRLWPSLLCAAQVVQPETILRWHRAGFKAFWRWKSRNRVGRPKIDHGLRDLIRRMSKENPLWGAPPISGGTRASSTRRGSLCAAVPGLRAPLSIARRHCVCGIRSLQRKGPLKGGPNHDDWWAQWRPRPSF